MWFGPTDRPLHGWLTAPDDGRATQGVVLCAPIGEEGRATYRTLRRLAEALAAAGLVALRFDYDGTGDSAGHPQDPDRVGAWLASIDAAIDLVRGTGVDDVSVVGMRLGATLAATALADRLADRPDEPDRPDETAVEPVTSLVLWDPVLAGRRYLREGEALHAFGEGQEAGGTPDDGLRHTPGFQYDAATAAGLKRVDLGRLSAVPAGRHLARRMLLLERHDKPGSHADVDLMRPLAATLEQGDAPGQDLLLDVKPSDTHVPEAAVAAITTWLAADAVVHPAVELTLPPAAGEITLPSAGVGSRPVREHGTRLGVRPGAPGLYGVVTEPVAGVAPGQPWVVLVNVAIEHHVGPGRRWVELARTWADLGWRVVRLDQSGVGDSPTRPGHTDDVLFAPEWVDDLPAVVRELGADGPVMMVSLCSGVYSSLEAAHHADVDSVFGANPRLTLWEAGYDTPGYLPHRRAAATPARPLVWLARRRRLLAGGLWRAYRQVAVWHAPLLFLDRVARRGTVVQVIACPDDAQHFTEVLAWRHRLRHRRRQGTLRLETTDRLDHSLLGRGAQELFAERSTAFLRERHEALGAPSNPSASPAPPDVVHA